jgi:hypothetical protein
MEEFFRSGKSPWSIQRNILTAGLLETFGKPSSLSGQRVETPGLMIAY